MRILRNTFSWFLYFLYKNDIDIAVWVIDFTLWLLVFFLIFSMTSAVYFHNDIFL